MEKDDLFLESLAPYHLVFYHYPSAFQSELKFCYMENKSSSLRLVLLLIDIQEAFIKVLPKAESFQRRCSFAAKAAHLLQIPVFITEQIPDKLGVTLAELRDSVPRAKVFSKTTFSAFGAENLEKTLVAEGIEHLLIAGLETSVCVYQTAMDALTHGFKVTLLSDCVGGVVESDSASVLDALRTATDALVLPSETVFYSYLGTALHPKFRSYQQLVKEARGDQRK